MASVKWTRHSSEGPQPVGLPTNFAAELDHRLSGFLFPPDGSPNKHAFSFHGGQPSWGCDLMPSGSYGAEMPDLGGCRPGNPSRGRADGTRTPDVAVSRLRPLADYRAAKTRAAKAVMAVLIGAVLAFGGFYLGWKLGSLPSR